MEKWINYFKKILINGGLFILIIFLTYKFVFSNLNFKSIFYHLSTFDSFYLMLAILAVFGMLAIETLIIKRNLKVLGKNVRYRSCIKYTFAGNFFSAITPAATGGQPMQVYLMKKEGIETDKSTLALMMDLSAYQSAIVTYAGLGFIFYHQKILMMFKGYLPVVIIGILFNLILLMVVFLTMFSDKIIFHIIHFITYILKFFRYKKIDAFRQSSIAWIHRYKKSSSVLRNHKGNAIINFGLMFIKIGLMFSAPFWIYKGLGLEGHSFLFILSMQAILHISYAALPLPGGVGIGETAFLISFGEVFGASLDTAMLLSRGIGFYLIVFISGISLLLISTQFKLIQKK